MNEIETAVAQARARMRVTMEQVYIGPPVPTTWDPVWGRYVNLSHEQIKVFESFREDLRRYIGLRRWAKEVSFIILPESAGPNLSGLQIDMNDHYARWKIESLRNGIAHGAITDFPIPYSGMNGVRRLSADEVVALYGYVVRYVDATHRVAADLLDQVNAEPQGITTREPVDAAFAAIVVK